jgi:tetratricopeptide (TPR) repeat protein
MYCQHCGAGLPSGFSQCPACGRRIIGAVALAADEAIGLSAPEDATLAGPAADETNTLAGLAVDQATIAPPGHREDSIDSIAETRVVASGMRAPPPANSGAPAARFHGPLTPGSAFGSRYQIIRLLGIGGMGAVYQAWDDALGVAVALKVIRPEVTADPAAARDLERRFKRELLLARQVTHKHVVRIHDLGEIDGIKYLTMPYIQGSDLGSLLVRDGKLAIPRAVAMAKQVVSGLQAAHEAGVVHRDLKPANIMIDADDLAVIMDFGIARSVSGGGMTMAGAVVGTLEYMAPEQAMAQHTDHRADIYAFGLILYDMVLGPRQTTRAESAVAELMARVQKPLLPARAIDPSIPEALERILDRCTQPDPAARYQTTSQLAHDLDQLDGSGRQAGTASVSAPPITRTATAVATPVARNRPLKFVAAAVLVIAVVSAGWMLRDRLVGPPETTGSGPDRPVSLAVLPFRNASGDASLDWLGKVLAEMVRTELGEAPGLRIVPADRLSQILSDLRISPVTELDAATLGRLSQSSNAELLIAGQYARLGPAIRLDAMLQGPNRTSVPLQAQAANDADIPKAVEMLAQSLRDNLSYAPAPAGAARSTLPGPTSASMAAMKAYSEGEQLARDNKHLEALKKFEAATKEDPDFAFAFAKLAQTYRALGYGKEADQHVRRAADLSERLPEEQRYVIDAMRAGIANDTDKAIEAYERLEKLAPSDTQILFDLARLYDGKGDFDRARDMLKRVLDLDPKYIAALIQIGQVEIRRRNFDEALKYLQPAFSEAVRTGNEPAKGGSLHAMGVAFKRLNKPADALNNYEQALRIRRSLGDRRGVAATLGEMGQAQTDLQLMDAALASYDEALKIRREIGDKQGVGTTLINLGLLHERQEQYEKALENYRQSLQIQMDLGNEAYQGLCQNNIATIHLLQGRYDDALTYFQQALPIREKSRVLTDVAETLHGLAETQAKIGQFDQALTNYLKALESRRKAGDSRGAAMVSHGMALVFAFQGRYAAALGAHEEALKTFREAKDRPLMADVLNGYGSSLVMVGRTESAREALQEASGLAQELKSARLIALTLNTQGDSLFYRGDYRSARERFEQALQVSAKSSSPEAELQSAINVAKTDVKDGRARGAVPKLQELVKRADSLRLRPLAAEAGLYLGEALLVTGDLAGARRELEAALSLSERLGLVSVAANAHFLLATTLTQDGNASGAARHLAEARKLVDGMQKEARTDDILGRDDLRRIVAAAPTSF